MGEMRYKYKMCEVLWDPSRCMVNKHLVIVTLIMITYEFNIPVLCNF